MSSPIRPRSLSHTSSGPPPRSPSPPSQMFHPSLVIPTPALLETIAGGAHYSGVHLDEHSRRRRRSSSRAAHESQELNGVHQSVLNDLQALYNCHPSAEIFERSFRKDVTFEDSLANCTGINEVAAQFFAMPKLFSESKTLRFRIMSSTSSPNQLIYWQQQEYTMRLFGKKKVLESVIEVELDEYDKIVRIVDHWGGGELPSWFGARLLRTLNAKLVPWLVRVPKMEKLN